MDKTAKLYYKTGIKWLTRSAVLAIACVGGWLIYSQMFNQAIAPVPVRLVKVELGDIEDTIAESGIVEFRGQQTLKSPTDGTVDRVLVEVGDRVEFNQELLTLRNPDGQANLATQDAQIQQQEITVNRDREKVREAEENLAAAQQELAEVVRLSNGDVQSRLASKAIEIRQQNLTLARDRVKVSEAAEKLAAAQQELQELRQLAERGFIPGQELRNQEDAVRTAESALEDARLTLNTGELTLERLELERQGLQQELQTAIAESATKVRQAESTLRQAQGTLKEAQTAVRNSEIELEKQQLESAQIEQQLQNNTILSPINGLILNILVKDGDGIQRGASLLSLGDRTQEVVQLQLSTLNAAKVEPNQVARVTVIGPSEEIFNGRVESIGLQAIAANAAGESTGTSGTATVPATVQLDNPSGRLIPGGQVSVEIILQQRQNVPTLETTVVQQSDRTPFVWVRDSQGNAQKQPVTLGLEGLSAIEILSGVRPGDEVIVPLEETPLEPGTPVIPQENPQRDRKPRRGES